MLKFTFSGADGTVAVPETLTSGMVGKEVCFSFSDEWDGLSKVAVFSAGNVIRDVVLNDCVTVIPAEVLKKPMRYLYVGVYGVSQDGTLVIPTIRVKGPFIEAGTDPSGDPALEPELPVWGQVLASLGNLDQLNTQTKDTVVAAINELAGSVNVLPAVGDLNELKTQAKDTVVAAINELASSTGSGLTETEKSLMLTLFKNTVYTSDVSQTVAQLNALWGGGEDSGEPEVHIHSYTSTVTTAATCTTAGVRKYICSCGHSYTEMIAATGHHYVDGVCTVCGKADPDYVVEVVLTGLSVVYGGGDVTEGTAVTDLTGILVTAEYSDRSTAAVTGYTLSGTIEEGSNTITVSYGGMTATFIVTGIAAEEGSGQEKGELLYNWDLTSSLTDSIRGATATLGGSATQDENGLTISGVNGSCYFGSDLFSPGRSFEVDVASADYKNSGKHGFCIMTGTSGVNGNGNEGLTYTNGGKWRIYAGSSWHTEDEIITDKDAIAGKTIRFVSGGTNSLAVYFDSFKLGEVTLSKAHTTTLQIGSSGTSYYNLVVTAVRVYGEVE